MKIIALDFETADNGPDSACALAMVAIEDGTISGQKSFLIRPPRDTFRFTYIHGITWAHVRNELIFAERIPEIEDFILYSPDFALGEALAGVVGIACCHLQSLSSRLVGGTGRSGCATTLADHLRCP